VLSKDVFICGGILAFALFGIGFDTEPHRAPFLELVRGWRINRGKSYRGCRVTEFINKTPMRSRFSMLHIDPVFINCALKLATRPSLSPMTFRAGASMCIRSTQNR